jgi:hypothetical protein
MRTTSDGMRERLNEIADELAVLAAGASMPSDKAFAEALAAELRRIEAGSCPHR